MTDASPNPSRRTFLTTSCAAAVGCVVATEGCGQMPEPNMAVTTGFTVADVAEGTSKKSTVAGLKVIVGRDAQGIYAMSSTCTHEGVTIAEFNQPPVAWQCPNHNSRFSATGEVLSAPATVPLPHYEVTFQGTGATATILVNKGTVVAIGVRATPPA